jgi:CheY-like chemotaxis protein
VMLRDLGYRVLTAADGAEALRICGENGAKVDLLLVDVVLPGGMKGDEVARAFGEACPGGRVLLMTGYTETAVVDHDHRDDGVQLIIKPFQRAQLARKVAELLGTVRAVATGGSAGVMAASFVVIPANAGTQAATGSLLSPG